MAKIDKKYHKLLNKILDKGRWYKDPNRKGVKRLQIPHYSFEYDLKDGFPAITTKKLYWKGIVGELLWFLKGETNIKYLIDNNINIWNKDAYNYYLKTSANPVYDQEEFIEYIQNNSENHLKNLIFGNVGRIYGAQWRNWRGSLKHSTDENKVDQISNLIKNLKNKPLATDHIVTAWNPAELDQMALPPCHKGFQIMVYPLKNKKKRNIFNSNPEKYGNTTSLMFKSNRTTWKYFNKVPKYGFDLVWEQRSVDTFLG